MEEEKQIPSTEEKAEYKIKTEDMRKMIVYLKSETIKKLNK